MNRSEKKIICRTPTPGRAPTNIPKWKYDAVRAAILTVLKREGESFFGDLPERVGKILSAADRAELGSITWHVTTVKLDMETKGEICRVPGKGRQRLKAL